MTFDEGSVFKILEERNVNKNSSIVCKNVLLRRCLLLKLLIVLPIYQKTIFGLC